MRGRRENWLIWIGVWSRVFCNFRNGSAWLFRHSCCWSWSRSWLEDGAWSMETVMPWACSPPMVAIYRPWETFAPGWTNCIRESPFSVSLSYIDFISDWKTIKQKLLNQRYDHTDHFILFTFSLLKYLYRYIFYEFLLQLKMSKVRKYTGSSLLSVRFYLRLYTKNQSHSVIKIETE